MSQIQGGAVDTTHTFAVGIKLANGGVCTGVLIAPNLVMTAQHCVSDAYGTEKIDCSTSRFKVKPVSAPDVTVTTDRHIKGAERTYSVANVVVPNETEVCGSDLALLVLDESVPAKEANPAVPLLSAMTRDKSVTGKIAAVGFGVTSKSAKDAGQRRIKESIAITCVPGGSKDCGKRGDSEREFRTAGGACSGDSGSGAFEQSTIDGHAPVVLGILSRVTYAGETCTEGVYTRTDAYASLIVAAGVQAWRKVKGTSNEYTAPEWTGVSSVDSAKLEETFASADADDDDDDDDADESSGSNESSGSGVLSGIGKALGGLGGGTSGITDALGGLGGVTDALGTVGKLGDFLGKIDWSKVIKFVGEVVPKLLDTAKSLKAPREDSSDLTEPSTTDPVASQTPAGNERSTSPQSSDPDKTGQADAKDDEEAKDDKQSEGADAPSPPAFGAPTGACNIAIDPSSPPSTLLLSGLGLLAVGISRRRRRLAN